MCKASDRPQRRHRAMYLAPTVVRPVHPQLVFPDNTDPELPSVGDDPDPTEEQSLPPPEEDPLTIAVDNEAVPLSSPSPSGKQFSRLLWTVYHWFVDIFLLMIVCFMGCFFYDVEVKVVKSDHRPAMARGRSGRVVIQTDGASLPRRSRSTTHLSTLNSRPAAPSSATRLSHMLVQSSRSRGDDTPV